MAAYERTQLDDEIEKAAGYNPAKPKVAAPVDDYSGSTRVDRHNNPIAVMAAPSFQSILDKNGINYEAGDAFPDNEGGSKYRTLKFSNPQSGNAAAKAILSNSPSAFNWYLGSTGKKAAETFPSVRTPEDFAALDETSKNNFIDSIAQAEGTTGKVLSKNLNPISYKYEKTPLDEQIEKAAGYQSTAIDPMQGTTAPNYRKLIQKGFINAAPRAEQLLGIDKEPEGLLKNINKGIIGAAVGFPSQVAASALGIPEEVKYAATNPIDYLKEAGGQTADMIAQPFDPRNYTLDKIYQDPIAAIMNAATAFGVGHAALKKPTPLTFPKENLIEKPAEVTPSGWEPPPEAPAPWPAQKIIKASPEEQTKIALEQKIKDWAAQKEAAQAPQKIIKGDLNGAIPGQIEKVNTEMSRLPEPTEITPIDEGFKPTYPDRSEFTPFKKLDKNTQISLQGLRDEINSSTNDGLGNGRGGGSDFPIQGLGSKINQLKALDAYIEGRTRKLGTAQLDKIKEYLKHVDNKTESIYGEKAYYPQPPLDYLTPVPVDAVPAKAPAPLPEVEVAEAPKLSLKKIKKVIEQGVQNATEKGIVPENNIPKYQGIPQGANIPKNIAEIRQDNGGQTGYRRLGVQRASVEQEAPVQRSLRKIVPEINIPPLEDPVRPQLNIKASGVAQSIAERAAERGHAPIEDLAKFESKTFKDQDARVSNLISSNPEMARKIVRGEASLPEGLSSSRFLKAAEEHFKNDPQATIDLSKSKLATDASVHGQELGFMRGVDPTSAVSAVKKLREDIRATAEKRLGNVDAAEALESHKIEQHVNKFVEKELSNTAQWKSFIDSIICK